MAELTLTPNLDRPDDFYAELIAAHDGLSEDESAAFNARLILILANQIGNTQVISAALRAATKPDR
ncbi:DUF2783 domain-containing protein [Antarctobacter heliothermus]|uniref:DUF2783 domain-containing protein n=1 Tax=Antarctobacter heliothermus TaxID=74033 RepID=A0A239H9L1_9RHOB|nr:DUF2783 domain-containing protein [Antarctobacter heliothermus]SNS78050.1 Protein of unknown function [Antarctobacter heliothermus]